MKKKGSAPKGAGLNIAVDQKHTKHRRFARLNVGILGFDNLSAT